MAIPPPPPSSRRGVLLKVAMFAIVIGVGVAALVLNLDLSADASSDLDDNPPPLHLYSDRQLRLVDGPLQDVLPAADRAANAWFASHPNPDGDAFVKYAIRKMPPPPGEGAQKAELRTLHALRQNATTEGDQAAAWFEQYGDKDIWEEWEHDYRNLAPVVLGDAANNAQDDGRDLGEELTDEAKVLFARLSPYQADESLHALNRDRFSDEVRYSFPSRHALISFSALTVLGHFEPKRLAEYRWMADEIAFSRIYAGSHYLSDLTAGAFAGRMIGDYELHFRPSGT